MSAVFDLLRLLFQLRYANRRAMLRSSWLDPEQLSSRLELQLRVVFMMGSSVDPAEQKYAEYESEMYGDVVQYSFIDDYQNNTYKAMSYLKYDYPVQ